MIGIRTSCHHFNQFRSKIKTYHNFSFFFSRTCAVDRCFPWVHIGSCVNINKRTLKFGKLLPQSPINERNDEKIPRHSFKFMRGKWSVSLSIILCKSKMLIWAPITKTSTGKLVIDPKWPSDGSRSVGLIDCPYMWSRDAHVKIQSANRPQYLL